VLGPVLEIDPQLFDLHHTFQIKPFKNAKIESILEELHKLGPDQIQNLTENLRPLLELQSHQIQSVALITPTHHMTWASLMGWMIFMMLLAILGLVLYRKLTRHQEQLDTHAVIFRAEKKFVAVPNLDVEEADL